MDLEYDRKFEEMKKYIPFLESMIKRLESTNNGVKNPRKAQLDKIRSLRDLLLDKKKRMKMENLLKCEQVLVNLYAKVEQRDSLTDSKEDHTEQIQKEKSDLNIVRNKLKSVVSKLQDDAPETLPEIARATNTEVVCTPGSKEPALFQRRPNKASPPRQSSSIKDDSSSNSKRHYTRVLMSPEHKKKEWLINSDNNTDKPLFSRRSPRRSPRRYSPSYKKERKKSSKQRSKSSQQSQDLNITLKVPQESLGSLNTKDILSRIINCSDSDVDIDTLRGLRSQILGELKQTGTKDDISDLILKSYKKKEKRSKKKDEIEEGELSDSESEAIENIYGSLVVVNQGESIANSNKISNDKKQPRKIQICLVINSDKEKDSKVNDQTLNTTLDVTDFEAYTDNKTSSKATEETSADKISNELTKKEINAKEIDISTEERNPQKSIEEMRTSPKKDIVEIEKMQNLPQENPKISSNTMFKPNFYQPFTEEKTVSVELPLKQNTSKSTNEITENKKDEATSKPLEVVKKSRSLDSSAKLRMKNVVSEIDILQALKKEILGETTTAPICETITPPLHQPKITKVASSQEIISKKRISIEKYKQKSVPSVKHSLFNSVNQQSTSKDDNSKKQSLKLTEKECERFNFPVNVSPVDSSEDEDKERWHFEFLNEPPKSPDVQNKEDTSMNFQFLRGDSAPKSPDHEDFADTGIKPPVIIPSDPVKNIVPNAKVDIDMRTLLPLVPAIVDGSKKSIISPSLSREKIHDQTNSNEKITKSISELRMRSDSNQPTANNSPRPNTNYSTVLPNISPNITSNIPSLMSLNVGAHMTPSQNSNISSSISSMTPILNSNIPLILNPNMAPNMILNMTPTVNPGLLPNMNPNMTPNRMVPNMNPMMTPIMTPNARSYEMTPRPNYDIDEYTSQKHVYAPIFPTFEQHDFPEKDASIPKANHWETNEKNIWEDRKLRSTSVQRDMDYHRNRNDRYLGDKRLDSPQIRLECPSTPNPSFGRMECPSTPNPSFGRMDCPSTPNPSFGRMECPSTPNPSFGRMECPQTPNPSFGRMECPSTPNPSFGRMECPPTPNPSFGRMECPLTPNPSFGRLESSMTPVHSFGRSDCPMTPSHSFGRSDNNMTPSNVFGRSDYHVNTSNFSHKYTKSQDPRLNRSSDYDKCRGRNDERNCLYLEEDHKITENSNRYRRNQVKSYDQDNRNSRDHMSRRESSVGRSLSRDYEADDLYNKDKYNNDYQYRTENYLCTDDVNNKGNYRGRSTGRVNPSEENFSTHRERGMAKTCTRESSIEKPISVQSHTGRSFNIDTSFNRTFQETKSSLFNKSFDARRQRASSVGRSLRESPHEDSNRKSVNKNKFELDLPDRKTMQFRRACSVGRDLKDYNIDKNFKDIKEDLRSCKFNNYDFNLRDRDHKNKSRINNTNEKVSSNEYNRHQNNRDPRKRVRDDLKVSKVDDSSKYSPRKNFRDPRMRREIDVRNTCRDKYRERNPSSSRYKNYGIVYSNDNIAKGTILASTAGVKNFKIPKIKRSVEEKQVENDINVKKEVHPKSIKKEGTMMTDQTKKVDSKAPRSEATDKCRDKDKLNKDHTMKSQSREDITSVNKVVNKGKIPDETMESLNLSLETCERRITRSSIKGGTQSKEINKTSPVKKLRRIKKPLIYDSDSDCQEIESKNECVKKNIDGNKNLKITKDKETPTRDHHIDKEEKVEVGSHMNQPDEVENINSMKPADKNDITINLTNEEKNTLDNKSVPEIRHELCEEQNDSLDISFGVDDELFSDNIASGSVLDNINALIADLDHDIEAPKINDFNDKFIDNIVGNIPSNGSLISLGENQTDFASDVTLNEKLGFVVHVENNIECSNAQIAFSKDNTDLIEISKSNLENTNILLVQPEQTSGIENKSKENKNDKAKESAMPITENNNKTPVRDEAIKTICENQMIKIFNTDAVVSTTAHDEKSDEIPKRSQSTTLDCIPPVCPLVPDSTINFNENVNTTDKYLQESVPDSTNELASEVNITSTHNINDIASKEPPGANSTCVDSLPRIDSIGKLLSILEDKNKIKELLTLLGNDTGENEKIKKKLEKLSEIVSDDEESSGEVHKDTIREENQTIVKETQEKDKDIDNVPTLASEEKNECFDNMKSDKDKSIINNEVQCTSEQTLNIEVNKVDDEYQCLNVKEGEVLHVNQVNNVDDKNTKKQEVDTAINSDVEKGTKQHEVIENIKGDKDIVPEDVKQISEFNDKNKKFEGTLPVQLKTGKNIVKKSKITKRGRSKLVKNLLLSKDKRVTRSEAGSSQPQIAPVPKKPSRELLKLQEDIRDMFISEDILNATGIRMCRLAKLVDDKHSKGDTTTTEVEPEPIVVLENIKSKMSADDSLNVSEKMNKKKQSKSKASHNDPPTDSESKEKPKYKPGPKSKTKRQDDPYIFETESIGESNTNTVDSKDQNMDSDSDSVSAKSFESPELLVESKKKTKRKRRSWQLGVIRKKGAKTRLAVKNNEYSVPASGEVGTHETKEKNLLKIPDFNCFTDKSYCFHKNTKTYFCRLCGYRGDDIVPHYKKHHPHSEIPLSRLSPGIAKEAIEQCENMNLQAISKIQTMKYVCRFCFQEFHKQSTALETFFWHVVSVHTGEYKYICPECINVTRCPFHLDIPPPPKNLKGQLIGYICGRCNFTQVSLENLKTHVIVRHDDEQTEVYSINLGEIPRKVLQTLVTKAGESSTEGLRVLRSTRSNQSVTEPSDDHSDITESTDRVVSVNVGTGQDNLVHEVIGRVPPKVPLRNKIQSKLIFENDDMSDTSSYSKNDEILKASIKLERDDDSQDSHHINVVEESTVEPESELQESYTDNVEKVDVQTEIAPSTDVLDYAHFKIKLTGTGTKEYICCINGKDNHYKTTLLISFKKHVQLKHSENWDGYCFVCKVIVTGQGKHKFKDCLQHFLDKHMDNFPLFEEVHEPGAKNVIELLSSTPIKDTSTSKPYINVRPLSELISSEQSETQEVNASMPKIQSVVSLGTSDEPMNSESQKDEKVYRYEEAQTEVMSKKHRVVLEAMLSPEKLIQVFKCAGRFCSYTTDNAEEALLHASTHQKIGGECSLQCTYCDFDSSGNAIDLVMHVFKNYSHCSFTCSKCFYRAAVSQLVYAHIKRVHTEFDADKVPVLSSATILKDNTKDDLMSRDAAVLYYICNNRDPEEGDICQFKSYVLTKFREHLQTRHADDQEYSCYMCNNTSPSTMLLAQHLKSHGLRIYQCCRCLFGADNESELMAHASEKHPLKQPKAYLRIITSKGGSSEVRVLPLAVLSKSSVETTVVTPKVDKESPVKQAERSIDLEKLIGQTNLMIESMNTITNAATIEPVDITANEKQIQLESEQASFTTSQIDSESTAPAVLTLLRDPEDTCNKTNAIVKTEPIEIEKSTSEGPSIAATLSPPDPDVVCLDSDEESSRHNIIDLSGEDTPVELESTKKQNDGTDIKLPRTRLFKCSKCFLISKSEGMFKRHIISCFPNPTELVKCAYCSYATTANRIVIHYNSNHLESTVPYICAICNGKFVSLMVAKKHMKLIHNETSTKVNSKMSSTGILEFFIDSELKGRQPKRKLSGETGSKSSEPAPKLKKYGPQDVDKLPINPILDDLVYCSLCEFSTKVRLNMVRHLQLHAEQQPVPRTAPVNPVPHLESNEKHFDKMVNLASSSIANNSKTAKDGTITTIEYLSPEAAAIYPKYVPDKHRYTCGAKGCSYISVNESMFKIHWETLHASTNDYHCVHCPPPQHLDTTKPLTAIRIIAHLKMHDVKLYACSSCTFYHNTRKLIEKHLKDVHSGKLIIVREEGNTVVLPPPPVPIQSSTAPTMDLKPWQCGLCKFKSMIRPEVIEHCGKFHQSKMQFKCTYCGFRTSNIENISKHQSKQHPGKKEEVFYFYYREGSIPNETDGIARWQKQSQKSESEIKTETDIPPPDLVPVLSKPAPAKATNLVNLDIVKKEIVELDANIQSQEGIEDLCKAFGRFCDPNGLKYKCSLCKVIIEDTKEAMQSHLYEELQYRKWGCAVCSYKAFHKQGLQQHVQTEHRTQSRDAKEPVELQIDCRIETWVSKLLEHQTAIIEKNKENLAKQKAEILRANPGSSVKVAEKPVEQPSSVGAKNVSMAELEKLFGPFGVPSNMNYTCPKCNISARAEAVMQEHLESELNKIRWCCNVCNETFQTYHEAQFHCRSVHSGQSSRPVEATRDVSLRAAWVTAVLRVQKLSMNYMPVTETTPPEIPAQTTDTSPENSLLVVRYEEKVPTPEEQMKLNKKTDAEEDKLCIDESEKKKDFECQYCNATYKYESFFHGHVLKHYGLKPYTCPYCLHTDYKKTMESHIKSQHPNTTVVYISTQIPTNPLVHDYLGNSTSSSKPIVIEVETKIICLSCEEAMTRAESLSHYHDNVRPQFGMKGTVVYRCWTCLTLHKTSNDFNLHHKQFHANEKKNSSFYKLSDETRSLFCSLCNQNFGNMAQYRAHQQTKHGLKPCTFVEPTVSNVVIEIDDDAEQGGKRKAEDTTTLPAPKRVARKSTTKLPNVKAVARKSTTKLPYTARSEDEEYSYYGTRPSMDNLENVTTLMPFCNTFVPFSLKKLNEIIKIYPVVVVQDIKGKGKV